MDCIRSFQNGFNNTFTSTDFITVGDRPRADYAQNSLKKLLLMPIYTPFSIVRTICDLVWAILLAIMLICFTPCSKEARRGVLESLGCISGLLACLGWTPIRTTYLFFRSLYGAIINPKQLALVKVWERRYFQVQNARDPIEEEQPRIRLTKVCYSTSGYRVPSLLKYES